MICIIRPLNQTDMTLTKNVHHLMLESYYFSTAKLRAIDLTQDMILPYVTLQTKVNQQQEYNVHNLILAVYC